MFCIIKSLWINKRAIYSSHNQISCCMDVKIMLDQQFVVIDVYIGITSYQSIDDNVMAWLKQLEQAFFR
jgi:hypothetical protein